MKYIFTMLGGISQMKQILNLLTAFLAVIGICAASLIGFIVIYTQINGGFSSQRASDQSTIVVKTDISSTPETFTFSMEQTATSDSNNTSDTDLLNGANEEAVPMTSTANQTPVINNNVPDEYSSAISKAIDYSNMMYMSKASIYDQLISQYGEGFTAEAAQYAVDNMDADWNSNALQKAKDYSDTMHMSRASIYDQLVSDYGEKFTPSETQYAVDNLVTDYKANALQKAKEYQNLMNMSPDAIHEQLTSEYGEKFTPEEADYAINSMRTQ